MGIGLNYEEKIAIIDLGPNLAAQQDSAPGALRKHVSVGPAVTMSVTDFETAIGATKPKWIKVDKP